MNDSPLVSALFAGVAAVELIVALLMWHHGKFDGGAICMGGALFLGLLSIIDAIRTS